jgi:hypothetical protein
MRLVTYQGIDHKISERNWKQLLRRFDADKAILNTFGYYFIPVKAICASRDHKCIRCPLRDPHKRINSCTYIFRNIMGEDLLKHLYMLDSGIFWDPKSDREARLALSKVRKVLSQAKRVDRKGITIVPKI